jgi:hypothetical protein
MEEAMAKKPGTTKTKRVVGKITVQELKKQLQGKLLSPGDAGYEAARTVWNARIDRRPL